MQCAMHDVQCHQNWHFFFCNFVYFATVSSFNQIHTHTHTHRWMSIIKERDQSSNHNSQQSIFPVFFFPFLSLLAIEYMQFIAHLRPTNIGCCRCSIFWVDFFFSFVFKFQYNKRVVVTQKLICPFICISSSYYLFQFPR